MGSRYGSVLGAVLCTLALAAPAGLDAQAGAPLAPGARVRVMRPEFGSGWRQGTLAMLSPDSAAIVVMTDTLRFGRDTLGRFEWSRGVHDRTGKGALLGLGIGAGAGLLLGLAASGGCTGFCFEPTGGQIIGGAAILGVVGAGTGAMIGSLFRGESWRRVSPGRGGSSGASPSGALMSVSLGF